MIGFYGDYTSAVLTDRNRNNRTRNQLISILGIHTNKISTLQTNAR